MVGKASKLSKLAAHSRAAGGRGPRAGTGAGMAQRARNLRVGFALTAFAGACGAIPLWYTKRMADAGINLQQQEKPLSGTQTIRGAYINTGSKDAGVDPDWDFKERRWKGKRVQRD